MHRWRTNYSILIFSFLLLFKSASILPPAPFATTFQTKLTFKLKYIDSDQLSVSSNRILDNTFIIIGDIECSRSEYGRSSWFIKQVHLNWSYATESAMNLSWRYRNLLYKNGEVSFCSKKYGRGSGFSF